MCHTFGLIMFLMAFYYSLVIAEVFEGDVKPKVFFFLTRLFQFHFIETAVVQHKLQPRCVLVQLITSLTAT